MLFIYHGHVVKNRFLQTFSLMKSEKRKIEENFDFEKPRRIFYAEEENLRSHSLNHDGVLTHLNISIG